jgi:hypothetical protein
MRKTIQILIFITVIFGCNNQPKQVGKSVVANTDAQNPKVDNSKYHTQLDTIVFPTEIGDTLRFTKEGFNEIVDKHPSFFNEYPMNPDDTYLMDNDKEGFDSEIGKDYYYFFYGYFLKEKNGVEEFAIQRQKLIDIYANINSLFGYIQNGGTYFGHQNRRILGYAEYSIYILSRFKNDMTKTYDITKQKELYIKSLRQIIEDESNIDNNLLRQEKIERNKQLNKIVDDLEKLITDNFYLSRAQEFQYEYYEYY